MNIKSASKVVIRRKSDGKYLVLSSSEWEDNPERSHQPDLPGGMVEPGETTLDGLKREVLEETGISLKNEDLLLVYGSTYLDEPSKTSITFLVYYSELDEPNITLSWEHESYEWMDAAEVRSLEVREPYPVIFDHFSAVGLLE